MEKRLKENGGRLVKHPPKHEELGHIASDTVERITDGIKDYNTKRIYKSLNKKIPIQFIIEKEGLSQMSLSYISF